MPFCRQCGVELQETDRFCGQCGFGQVIEDTQPPPLRPETPSIKQQKAEDTDRRGYEYKGVGIRFVAQIVDTLICLIIFGFVGSFVAGMVGGGTADGFELKGASALLVQVVTLAFAILYFAILETYWNGQTLGKKITGIQVISEDGSSPAFSTSMIRNIMRIVDGFAFYLVAAISVWASSSNQRLGDRIAHTYVVKKRKPVNTDGQQKRKRNFTSKDDVYISDLD